MQQHPAEQVFPQRLLLFLSSFLLVLWCAIVNPTCDLVDLCLCNATLLGHGAVSRQFLYVRGIILYVFKNPEIRELVAVVAIVNGARNGDYGVYVSYTAY